MSSWHEQVDDVWARSDDPALALFERGGSRDSASTLRNLGRLEESLDLLRSAEPYPPYAAAFAAFETLTLASLGRPVEGPSLVLTALAPTLPRYQRWVTGYAAELLEG